ARGMTIVWESSYPLESIIQAGKKRMAIAHVPVSVNPHTRQSRLFDSTFSYIKRSSATIVRIYTMYEPLKVFTYLGLAIFALGLSGVVRFVYFYSEGLPSRHLGSMIASSVLIILSFIVFVLGLIADVNAANRKLLEELIYRVRALESPTRESEHERPVLTRAADRADRWEH